MLENFLKKKTKNEEAQSNQETKKKYEDAIKNFTSYSLDTTYLPSSTLQQVKKNQNELKNTFLMINSYMWEHPNSSIEFTLKQMLTIMDIIILEKFGQQSLNSIHQALTKSIDYYGEDRELYYSKSEKLFEEAQKLAPACKIAIEYALSKISNQQNTYR